MTCATSKKARQFAIGLFLALSAQTTQAATTAYWRHEEGTTGALIAPGPGSVLDSSGNGNHMRTFDPAFTSGLILRR